MFRGFAIIWIVLELLVFVAVAKLIGVFAAILLIVLSMVIGGMVLRYQSFNIAMRAQEKAARGEPPTEEMLHAAAVVMGGMFMIIPGFLSSVIGILLLIPFTRHGLTRWLLNKHVMSNRFTAYYQKEQSTTASGRVIDSETVEENKKND